MQEGDMLSPSEAASRLGLTVHYLAQLRHWKAGMPYVRKPNGRIEYRASVVEAARDRRERRVAAW